MARTAARSAAGGRRPAFAEQRDGPAAGCTNPCLEDGGRAVHALERDLEPKRPRRCGFARGSGREVEEEAAGTTVDDRAAQADRAVGEVGRGDLALEPERAVGFLGS